MSDDAPAVADCRRLNVAAGAAFLFGSAGRNKWRSRCLDTEQQITGPVMPRYTIRIANEDTAYEASDIVLPDPDQACELAVKLVADLFLSGPAAFGEGWATCSIRVVAEDGEQVFAASAAEAALIERDLVRSESASLANN